MKLVQVTDLGVMPYQEAWGLQTRLHQQLVTPKLYRNAGTVAAPSEPLKHHLLLLEHPHVYTLGKSGSESHLLLDAEGLTALNATYHKINRGGDITYHGPGQLVVYSILDLDHIFTDVHRYVRTLEECVILTLADYKIEAIRLQGFTGVWLPATSIQPERKICALGVHLSRWVTLHGLGFNINTDLSYFNHIVPCGINANEKSVTSMAQELGHPVDMKVLKSVFSAHFCTQFQLISENDRHD